MTEINKTYVFLDEIQNVTEFQRVVDSLYLRKNLDVYITCSNAWVLSGDFATLRSGRYVKIEMLPLSFKEYSSVSDTDNLGRLYIEYLENSSFPGALRFKGNQQHILGYFQGIYNSVILRDVISRVDRVLQIA